MMESFLRQDSRVSSGSSTSPDLGYVREVEVVVAEALPEWVQPSTA